MKINMLIASKIDRLRSNFKDEKLLRSKNKVINEAIALTKIIKMKLPPSERLSKFQLLQSFRPTLIKGRLRIHKGLKAL